ncbi:MAG TPA: hypothetical protein VGZ02_17575 [Candidatus Baltobacteraceae bacterium]|nr:hypothetical protein [Candidatus Baltobacteraceae bacterium]
MTVAYNAEQLRSSVRDYLKKKSEPPLEPAFSNAIAWSGSYEDLFRAKYATESSDITDLVTRAMIHGRVILSSRGGAAKTVILRRLAEQILSDTVIPTIIDLRNWTQKNYDEWSALENSDVRMDYLFSSVGLTGFSTRALDILPANVRRLIFVDGLNEVTSPIGQQIISVVDDFVRYAINTGAVIADRLVRRERC